MKKVAAMTILRCQDQYLLMRRGKMPNLGKYAPVGGKLEAGENPLEAARREVLEETGLSPQAFRFCGVISETAPDGYDWIAFVYIADIAYVEPPACSEGTLEWIPITQAAQLPGPATHPYTFAFVQAQKPFVLSARYNTDFQLIELIEEIEQQQLV